MSLRSPVIFSRLVFRRLVCLHLVLCLGDTGDRRIRAVQFFDLFTKASQIVERTMRNRLLFRDRLADIHRSLKPGALEQGRTGHQGLGGIFRRDIVFGSRRSGRGGRFGLRRFCLSHVVLFSIRIARSYRAKYTQRIHHHRKRFTRHPEFANFTCHPPSTAVAASSRRAGTGPIWQRRDRWPRESTPMPPATEAPPQPRGENR